MIWNTNASSADHSDTTPSFHPLSFSQGDIEIDYNGIRRWWVIDGNDEDSFTWILYDCSKSRRSLFDKWHLGCYQQRTASSATAAVKMTSCQVGMTTQNSRASSPSATSSTHCAYIRELASYRASFLSGSFTACSHFISFSQWRHNDVVSWLGALQYEITRQAGRRLRCVSQTLQPTPLAVPILCLVISLGQTKYHWNYNQTARSDWRR